MNKVEVEFAPGGRHFAYDAGKLRLKVGDQVVVPAPYWTTIQQTATVVSLTSEFPHACKPILRRARRKRAKVEA